MSGRDCSDGQAMVQGTLICKNKNILIVLGHFSSSSSFEAGKIYQKMNIPAITASFMSDALINSNDWYFRVIPGASIQALFVANFIKKELKIETVELIITDDHYGFVMA